MIFRGISAGGLMTETDWYIFGEMQSWLFSPAGFIMSEIMAGRSKGSPGAGYAAQPARTS